VHSDLADEVKVVFVTVDPDRDDSERLRQFLDAFDERFVGLTGTAAEIDSASQSALGDLWRPFATYVTHHDDYTVSHPAFVVAYGLDNKAHVLWGLNTRTADYANDIELLMNEGTES
jgi:protein SCO1/2